MFEISHLSTAFRLHLFSI